MSTPPDWDALARRYLDLWQRNISDAASDPDVTKNTAQLFGQIGAFMGPGMSPGMAPGMGTGPDSESAAPRTSPPDELAKALAGIERRLATIERRLEELNATETTAAKRGSAKPAAKAKVKVKPAKPRSAKSRPAKAPSNKPRSDKSGKS